MIRPSDPSAAFPLFAGLLLVVGLLPAGCTSSRPSAPLEGKTEQTWTPSEVERHLQSAARKWQETPHEWGGASTSGVDCSGLVQSVFAEKFQLSVPRTTEQQARVGRTVSRSTLKPGDLVFFRTAPKKRHVGIYLSDGEFLHASSSEGVTVSPLDRSYWTDHWWHARRLIHFPDSAPREAPDTTRRAPKAATVGW